MSTRGPLNSPSREISRIFAQRIKDPAGTLAALDEQLSNGGGRLRTVDLLKLQTGRASAMAALNRFAESIQLAVDTEELLHGIDSPDPEVVFELRRIRTRQALYDKRSVEALRLALKNLQEAEALDREQLIAQAHSDAASVYGSSGDRRKALHHLQQSLQRTPESNTAQYGALLNNLGMVYLSVQRAEEAIACFIRAREAFSAVNNDMQVAMTFANEGQALTATGKYERAIELQKQALELLGKGGFKYHRTAAMYTLGNTLFASGKINEAEELYRQSVKLSASPDYGNYEHDARKFYGRFLVAEGRHAEAAEQFEALVVILRAGGTNATLHQALQNLADAQEASGARDAALLTLKELVQLQDSMVDEPARSSSQSEVTELELSLEWQVELVSATASALVEANRKLSEQAREFENLAATDHLTSLRNRRYFMEKLEHALLGSRKSDANQFSLMFLDIDDFKAVNDRFGHETGDLVLQSLAEIMRAAVRNTDVVARWGGEEFAVLLHGADSPAAEAIAQKLLAAVNAHSWSRLAPDLGVTVSAGLIVSSDYPDATADDIMNMVDRLLYKAKLAGRNRIERASEHLFEWPT